MCRDAPVLDADVLVFEYADPIAGAIHGSALLKCVEQACAGIPAARRAALLPSWPAVLSLAWPEMVLALTGTWDRWWDVVENWLVALSRSVSAFWHPKMPGRVPRSVQVDAGHPLWDALCNRDWRLRGQRPRGPVVLGRHACAFESEPGMGTHVAVHVQLYAGVRAIVRVPPSAVVRGVARDPEWMLRVVDQAWVTPGQVREAAR
jgi:hypothetical protein